MAHYSQIREMDISNGLSVGVAVFFSGCEFRCKNCFNKESWDFSYGKEWNEQSKELVINLSSKSYIKRLSILGGECLHPLNILATEDLVLSFKNAYPDKKIWIWTGYNFEDVTSKIVLEYVDYIIDGQYIDQFKDWKLQFRGSGNQRLWENKNGIWSVN